MSLFAVVIKDPLAPPQAAAAFLAGVKGFNRDSAREHLRRQPGFLGRGLTLEAGGQLQSAAAAAGLAAMLVKEEAIPAPPPPLRAVKIEFKGSGFNYTAASLIDFIPYVEVTIFTAGAFDAPVQPLNTEALKASVFYKMRNELLGGGPLSTELNPARETFFRADLLSGGGKLRLLLEPENMDFSTLGLERGQSSQTNFRTLLGKLAAPAFGATKNAFLLALLAGKPLTPLKLASAEACDLEFSRIMLATARK